MFAIFLAILKLPVAIIGCVQMKKIETQGRRDRGGVEGCNTPPIEILEKFQVKSRLQKKKLK